MGLCSGSVTLTFNGVRADDLGQPEQVSLTITKYGLPSTTTFGVAAYDLRYDTEMQFSPFDDGVYKVQYIGNVSGLIETDIVLVNLKSNQAIGKNAMSDIKKLMCNQCVDDSYVYKKALAALSVEFADCEKFLQSEGYMDDIVSFDDCENKVLDCGDGC